MFTETEIDAVSAYLTTKVIEADGDYLDLSFELGLKQVFIDAFLFDEAAAQAAFEEFEAVLVEEPDPNNPLFWQDCAYAVIEDNYDLLTAPAKADVLTRIGA